ncbi:protein toll-like isoform X3 [Lingula anatina]|uniref:Protein toll-like isoform X2 n=1 Tax=Lingula anatina TaxID=7574 RepID=A0A1S3K403_LINAN|nr:protein toll-like isoform X2 [Lingula anatina]XP_013417257.1 protein toll-like isoform X3 [Lingula anatina]|eukprot:XP_013417256.1 protein toll-like isoform X2 [Lingula anatina]
MVYSTLLTIFFLSAWLESLCWGSCPSNCLCNKDAISCKYLEKNYTTRLVNVTKETAMNTVHLTVRAQMLTASYQRFLVIVRRTDILTTGRSYIELEHFSNLETLTIITSRRFFIEIIGYGAFSHLRKLNRLVIREERPENHNGYFDPTRIIEYPAFGHFPQLEYLNIHLPAFEYGTQTLKYQPFHRWPWGVNASFPRLRTFDISMNITVSNPCDAFFKPFLNATYLDLHQTFISNTHNYSLGCFEHLESLTMGKSLDVIGVLNSIPGNTLRSLHLNSVELKDTKDCALHHRLKTLTAFNVLPNADMLLKCMQIQVELETLILKNSNIRKLRRKDLKKFTNLKVLVLAYNSISTGFDRENRSELVALTNKTVPNLNFLDLSYNEITSISELITTDLIRLEIMNVSHNYLQALDLNEIVGYRSLRELFLSFNSIRSVIMKEPALSKVPSLWRLDLGHNLLEDIPRLLNVTFPNLQRLNVEDNKISTVSSELVAWKNIRYLNVKNNLLTRLDPGFFDHLDFINLAENEIKDVSFLSYLSGAENLRLSLRDNHIQCDCETIATLHALRQFGFLQDLTLTCDGNSALRNVNILHYETVIRKVSCEHHRDCFRNCRCFRTKEGKALVHTANCSDSQLTGFPASLPLSTKRLYVNRNQVETFPSTTLFSDLQELQAADNNIGSISNSSFTAFPKLQYINLDRNGIAEVVVGTFDSLLFLSMVSLKGNSLHCDCSQRWIQDWIIKRNLTFIATCNDTTLTNFDFTEQCDKTKFILNVVALAVVLVVLAVFIALVAITFFYRTEVEVLIYNRYKQFSRDDSDTDKDYDIFISYSNDDSVFVRNVIIQKMETEWGYKLCIHERDFLPGEYIADNIANAVEKSRRTLTLLSDSYLHSEWCVFEFAMAHQQSLKDRCRRLVVVKLSDLDSNLLAKENMG